MMKKILSVLAALALVLVPCLSLAEDAANTYTMLLDGNPTTGYEWTAAVDNADVRDVTVEYQADDSALVGAGGHYAITMTGKAAGDAVVTLTYARSWEGEALYTMIVNVNVAEDLSIAVTGSAFHEGEEELEAEDVVDFDITMDKVPEGYSFDKEEADGAVYVTFTCEGKPTYFVSVAYIDYFDGYTLNTDDLANEEMEELNSMLTEGYSGAAIYFSETAYGTDLIVVDETAAESDYGEIITIYEGYFITCTIMGSGDAELTADDYTTGVQILSDMWMIEK